MILNTFIYVPVRTDYIHKCLDSLYKYTDMTNNRVIVVDQTLNGLQLSRDQVHLVLRPHRNLGFAKANNEGIIHALRWGSQYVTCANEDIEYMDPRWWSGILETFDNLGERCVAVNPMSPREPGWGYGWEHGKYIDLLPYKQFTPEDYDYLLKGDFSTVEGLPDTYPRQKTGVIDAIATWHTTFNRKHFSRVGLFDERYYPGGGEDYDLNGRTYKQDLRMVGTTKSWVWHWWGQSKDVTGEYQGTSLPILDSLRWMNPDALWPPERNFSWNEKEQKMVPTGFDPWGKVTLSDKQTKMPMYRVPEIDIVDL